MHGWVVDPRRRVPGRHAKLGGGFALLKRLAPVALVWVNVISAAGLDSFWEPAADRSGIGDASIAEDLLDWVNDGLMASSSSS